MEYLTTLYRDTSTCGISQASSDSPGKSGWALNTAWFLQHLNAKIIIIPMQWHTTILIWKVPVRITTSLSQGVFTYQLHTSTVCTDPTCIITEALFPAHPLLFVLYCSLQLKSGLDDFKSSSFFYPFKTLMLYSLFPWLPAVLSFRLQERFWFPTLYHSSINFIFCFSFSWCFPGTCSWFHKLRWQFAQTTGVKFARVITLIVRAII